MAAAEGSDILQRMRKNQKRIRKEMQKLQVQKEQLLSSNRVSYTSRKRARTCLLTPESVSTENDSVICFHETVNVLPYHICGDCCTKLCIVCL